LPVGRLGREWAPDHQSWSQPYDFWTCNYIHFQCCSRLERF
jgi:hypothetical protein